MLANIFEQTLPIEHPVLRFLLILVIILLVPLFLSKIKIPSLLGLIVAGAVIGPKGIYLMERDSGIILSGTAGLLYIMFLAGLEIDLVEFKKNSVKSVVFGLYTFFIPMILGILSSFYILQFSLLTSVLLASMYASHTLIAYPLISQIGVAKNKAVTITVGGTMITDTLALLVLAIIVGMTKGNLGWQFWLQMVLSLTLFGGVVLLVFPLLGRWFFKQVEESVAQYVFVLVMVFLGAVLAELAGVEAIIGAFLSGLALNRLISRTSPLMNRIEFVGSAIFIPFFLIGVGMLIDYRVFFKDLETLKVALVMIVVATSAKFIAAWLTQKTYGFSLDERRLVFGLSNAQAAATLAAVLVGYNIIIDHSPTGEPIRLLNDSVLNGTILMILFTCTIASFVAQKGAKNIALSEDTILEDEEQQRKERILIPISNQNTLHELIHLGMTLKSEKNKNGLYALNIINSHNTDAQALKKAKNLLHKAAITAASADVQLHEISRYDANVLNGITNVIREFQITDLILGLHIQQGLSDSFLGNLTEGILGKCNITTLIYKPLQPIATIRRHFIIVPPQAEKEIGFPFWLIKVWNIAKNSGATLTFYAPQAVLDFIAEVQLILPIEAELELFDDWEDFLVLARKIQKDDNLIIVLSRKDKISYHNKMKKIPHYINKYLKDTSYILIYPMQIGVGDSSHLDLKDLALIEPLEKLDEISRTIAKIFKK
ncbi:cation:proton antiporter [Hugenholtzia roseola]|uniref:cation:proton antiporter n=1 Tax=Hugenholtzia roseola TaxID=1002 RepID=UPI00047A63B3|nr:cation:proton antiporter [Hugenholtzia roseola]